MKVELSIKDDKELRDMIKDMIRGQVTSVIREDIQTIVNEQIARKVANLNMHSPTMKDALDAAVRREAIKMGQALMNTKSFQEKLTKMIAGALKPSLPRKIEAKLLSDFGVMVREEIANKVGEIPLQISISAD